jgi:hypothetical protein
MRASISAGVAVLFVGALVATLGSAGTARGARNVVLDPGFEAAGLGAWSQCGSVNARISTAQAHHGARSMRAGSTSRNSGEIDGDAGLCQAVTVPAGGTLTFWVFAASSETSTQRSYQEAELLDDGGNTVAMLWQANANTNGWAQKTVDVSAFAGRTLRLYFGVHGDGAASKYTYAYFDDINLSASGATAPPTAVPTAVPTALPSGATFGPTAVPTPTGAFTPPATAVPGGPTPIPAPAGGLGATCGNHCGTERWHVKTMSDPFAAQVNRDVQITTVDTLWNAAVPAGMNAHSDNVRFAPWELQAVQIRATIVGWKVEADNDFHIVVADLNTPSETMIVEPPSSACSGACTSGYAALFQSARDAFAQCLGGQPSNRFTPIGKTVVAEITGVPYFDPIHGQTGVARNGIEIHPVLSVSFVSGC